MYYTQEQIDRANQVKMVVMKVHVPLQAARFVKN